MDTKRTIAERIHTIVPELDQEQVVNLLEIQKIQIWEIWLFLPFHSLKSSAKLLK